VWKLNLPRQILSLIDLTSLNDSDTEESIAALCQKAVTPYGNVAAVCIYPQFVKQAADALMGSGVKIATVANFPQGNASLDPVLTSIYHSILAGAQEIDVVFPYMQYVSGERAAACEFIHACKQKCGSSILLKVILETGAFPDVDLISTASRDVLLAGADFIKTSTGKIAVGATLNAATAMLKAIKELSSRLNRPLGFKASGGIRTMDEAAQYINLADEIMGADWVAPVHFRLGASQLLDTVKNTLLLA
jgi:deoxyribose-phosphate aldolase